MRRVHPGDQLSEASISSLAGSRAAGPQELLHREIAQRLFISQETVKTHVSTVIANWGCVIAPSSVMALRMGTQRGLNTRPVVNSFSIKIFALTALVNLSCFA